MIVYMILIVLLAFFVFILFIFLKYKNKLESTWPKIDCNDVLSDSNNDWDMVKRYSLVEYHYIDQYKTWPDELSTFNMQCFCDALIENKGKSYAK